MDGELSSEDAALLQGYLDEHPEEAAWMENLDTVKNTEISAADHSVAIASIRDAIASDVSASTKQETGKLLSFSSFVRPLAAAAAITIVGTLTWLGVTPSTAPITEPSVVEFVETDMPNASTFIHSDEETGWTVVWVDSEPVPQG